MYPWNIPEEEGENFFDIYLRDPATAMKKFPELFKMAQVYFNGANVEMHRNAFKRVSDEVTKNKKAAFGGGKENNQAVNYGNAAFGGGRVVYLDKEEKEKNDKMHRNTSNRENDEVVKHGNVPKGRFE